MKDYLWVSPKSSFSLRGTMPRLSCIDTLCIFFIERVVCRLDCNFVVNVGFLLGNIAYIVLCLNEKMTVYFGFADGPIRYTLNLAIVDEILYSPTGDLVSLGGTCLGPATKNIAKHHVVIGLLT